MKGLVTIQLTLLKDKICSTVVPYKNHKYNVLFICKLCFPTSTVKELYTLCKHNLGILISYICRYSCLMWDISKVYKRLYI